MKKILIFLFIVLACFVLLFSFYKKENNFELSYYSWENSYKEEVLDEKMYIKILDIKYSNKLEIIETNFIKNPPKDFIPVIFITNKTLQNIDSKELVKAILESLKRFNFSYSEIQIDSDWSISTKNNFFIFLKELKKESNKILSATIRLHQIKFHSKTGVPPVDYGVLMYYNMSNLGDFDTRNYILDNENAKKYHYNFDTYPLKLKLALPLYSQAVQFRDKKAVNLFENVSKNDFTKNFKNLGNSRYKVLKSHYFKGIYIYENDILRFEDSKEEELKIAFNDFINLSKNHFNEVIFYTFKYKNRYNLQKLINNKGSN
ncbi:hypothetical protein [Aliarcobacter thereius]|uniref:Uncharacterized protein n=2 Tax=Aliarcobacter thereius TaxID=544718 RepID=A0A1C0B7K6_9BACT|nr:hypothetical protein [Aliarcobacter thereius]OCL95524.1 hypothetical protein AA347_00988 [Aliarcobacter thereius LMG 24486]OCL99564.1 hypothetical protein AAX29_00606 [Aliarcobacter thereius]QBF16489.1 hypothetical protein ATH_1459 [Aliarcobacter thereius LMG 24486]TLS93783.1 hypothetical protein FE244_04040 [Aliarcobacter thereius]TLT08367.1 hypothetical protein FE243_00280 [Aliarcobacter thereius]